jgi:hypothetical protein
MAIYKSAMGKNVDMGKLFAQNETMRAVTNNGIKMNARGDIIDTDGTIVESVNDRVAKHYDGTVVQQPAPKLRPRDIVRQQQERAQIHRTQPQPQSQPAIADEIHMTDHERELEADMADDIEIERMKSGGR